MSEQQTQQLDSPTKQWENVVVHMFDEVDLPKSLNSESVAFQTFQNELTDIVEEHLDPGFGDTYKEARSSVLLRQSDEPEDAPRIALTIDPLGEAVHFEPLKGKPAILVDVRQGDLKQHEVGSWAMRLTIFTQDDKVEFVATGIKQTDEGAQQLPVCDPRYIYPVNQDVLAWARDSIGDPQTLVPAISHQA